MTFLTKAGAVILKDMLLLVKIFLIASKSYAEMRFFIDI